MSNITRDPLARAFQLLRWLTRERLDSIGVRETAAALSIAPSTAHNLLAALAAEGVLQQDARTGRYMLGLELFQLAHHAIDQVPLRRLAMPHLRRLVEACNEAAHLSLYVPERGELVTLAGVESTHTVRYVVDLYSWRPLHVGAAGWAVLAFLPAEEREALARRSPAGRKAAADLTQELDLVRARGYALTFGTRITGAVGLGAPLFDPAGAVIGAVGLAMPEQRFDRGEVGRLSRLLLGCAHDLMAAIGSQAATRRERPSRRRALAAKP